MAHYVGEQFGNYRLLKRLGDGGFAEVYLGEHIHLGTLAAIKVLATKLIEGEIEQFRNEARTMIGLKHPNIMRVHDFGLATRIPFIVMDYAPGDSLRKLHPKGTRLPLSTVVSYAKQIAAALQYVHEQKLIHRDVKPENMLLGEHNEILLSDFGIAEVAHGTQSLNIKERSGTIYYMAPEQIQGKPRPASDQYSLGVVIYEWLCGVRPFDGTYWEVADQHLSTSPRSLREQVPNIPYAVEQVVLKTLEKDQKQRFPSIQAFSEALEDATSIRLPVGTKISTYNRHTDTVTDVKWSPDSRFIASQSISTYDSFHLYEALTGKVMAVDDSFPGISWSPDGTSVAFGGIREEMLVAMREQLDCFSDDFINIYNIQTGKIVRDYADPNASLSIRKIAWSPDGKHIAANDGGLVKVWNVVSGRLVSIYKKHRGSIFALAWLADGEHIVSAGDDHEIHLWNVVTGKALHLYKGHASYVVDIAPSPNNEYIASASRDKTVHVWDMITGRLILIYGGHRESVQAITWSQDSRMIASGSIDHTVQIWEVPQGWHVFTYSGHVDKVQAVAWSPNGQYIASAGQDKTIQIWQAPELS